MISAIVLAAGKSKRMLGENKLLKKYRNRQLIDYILKTLAQSNIKKIIIVVGYQHNKIIHSVRLNKKVIFALNKNYKQGISSSIKCGIKKLNNKDKGFLIILADMPFITKVIINNICKNIVNNKKAEIFIPVYKGQEGNPVGFKTSFIKKIEKIKGKYGAKKIIKSNKEKISYIKVESKSILNDFDKKGDFIT